MSSSSHCARPTVPPKPDKDKFACSPPPPLARNQPDPFGIMKLSTVGTQVNMLRKPATSTSSSTGSRPPRSPSSEGRLQSHEESSDFESATGKSKLSVTSPKPALPPKPKPSPSTSAINNTTTNSSTSKKETPPVVQSHPSSSTKNSSTVSKTTSTLNSKFSSSTSSSTSKTTTSLANARISQFENLKDANSNSKSKEHTPTVSAPVARIDELDNLSDFINSPSPVKIQSPPQSLRQPQSQASLHNKSTSGVAFASKPPPHGGGLQSHVTSTSNSRTSTLISNPATSPRNVGPHSMFQFPPSSTVVSKPLFSTQQIQQRQAKSASLGRNINFNTSTSVTLANNFSANKKSTTLSARVTPLDLQLANSPGSGLVGTNNTQDAKFLRVKSPNSAPVVPARPISFSKPISAAIFSPKEAPVGSVPPPPPPRMRKAQRAQSISSPTSDSGPLSPKLTHQSSLPISPDSFSSIANEYVKPVYATVDKEKKWADRQRQQKQQPPEPEHNAQNSIIGGTSATSASAVTAMEDDEFGVSKPVDSELEVVHSSLTICSKSWLGKFIEEENKISPEPSTDSEHESMIIQRPSQNKNKNPFTDKSSGSSVYPVSRSPNQNTTNVSHVTAQIQSLHTKSRSYTTRSNNNEEDELVEAYNPNINVASTQNRINDFDDGSTNGTNTNNPFALTSASLNKHSVNHNSHNLPSEQQVQKQKQSATDSGAANKNNYPDSTAGLSAETKDFSGNKSPSPIAMLEEQDKNQYPYQTQNQIQSEEIKEKEPLGRNESFLFAMLDTNLKLKSMDLDGLAEAHETDNTVTPEEIILSTSVSSAANGSSTDVVTATACDNDTTSHGSHSNNNKVPNYTNDDSTSTATDEHKSSRQHTPNFGLASKPKTTLDLDTTNSFLFATFTRPELISISSMTEEPEVVDSDEDGDHTSERISGASNINVSSTAIPNRESVFDTFEKELENQLESLDYESQLAHSATFNNHEDNSFYRNRYANNSNNSSNNNNSNNTNRNIIEGDATAAVRVRKFDNDTTEEGSKTSDEIDKNSLAVSKNDPAKYLEFVDSRLQSMKHLLVDIGSSSVTANSADQHQGNTGESQNYKPTRVTFSETGGSGKHRRETDGDIVTNILLSTKRFEKNDQNQIQNNKGAGIGIGITGRRATAPDLISSSDLPDTDTVGSGPSSLVSDTTTIESTSDKHHDLHRSLEMPGQDSHETGIIRRRSWNSSDYSPSPSESSSSSCSYGHSHPRRSCHDCSLNRRKQFASSWIDEDELSTGALGDGESSDAPAPSSVEDIDHAVQGDRVVKRKPKHGFVSGIFSSFGKGGQNKSAAHSNYRNQTRSQFFLDSEIPPVPDAENMKENRRMKDKTMSLPAVPARQRPPKGQKQWSTASEAEVGDHLTENGHRPLRRSPVSASILPLPIPPVFPIVESDSKTETEFDDKKEQQPNQEELELEQATSMSIVAARNRRQSDIASILSAIGGDSSDVESVHSNSTCYDDVLADLTKSEKKSFYVARELLTSERTFVDVLNLLTLDFPLAMKMASDAARMPVISAKDMDFILGGLPSLKTVNEVLVSDLEKRISGWRENPKVADIIVKTGPFLKHYSTYVRDFERIVQRLESCCKKSPAFDQALKDFEGNVRCQKLGLRHYMLKPIQRMPQYRLLLEDYRKTLTEESEDYGDTLKAIAIVREVAEHANDAINLQINAEKLMNLQNRLPNIIVLKTNRYLLKEGELLKVCRKELQPRYFALMTDCLLCMTYNASTGATNMKDLKLRYELPLTGMRVSLPQSEDYSNEFSLVSTSRSFNLVAKASRERDEWMKALNAAIQDNIKKRTCTTPDPDKEFRIGSEAPVWIQDKRVTMCQVCTAEFTVTFRRHHCRACGKVVCGQCSANQAPLRYKNNEADRVCDDCYQYLLEEFDHENSEKNTSDVNIIRSRFKKLGYNTSGKNNRQRRSIPDKFKMQANNSDARISGYLLWRERKAWKRHWFVLMDRVLYVYAASEDIVAMRTIPVLGYEVESVPDETFAGIDAKLLFKLTHSGQTPIFFQAETASSAEKWLEAIKDASILK